jgi:hypothetical protein
MQNDYNNYYLLVILDEFGNQSEFNYNNAEAARKHAHMNEHSNPDGARHLYKMLQGNDPIEVMV